MTVARYLAAHSLPATAVGWPELADCDWERAGVSFAQRPAREDDAVGVTGAYCGVAETGSLVLLSGPRSPLAASLLPETHVVVMPAARLVATLEDVWARLREERRDAPRAVHLVSGPSRTADIEQTVTLGAHGPYRVHAVIVR